MENEVKILYIEYVKKTYTKNTVVRVRKVAKYNWEGNLIIAVHHVEDNGDIIGYTCHGEHWVLSYGDTFSRYIPIVRTRRS